MPILFRDFETRSTLSLPDVGAWRYATHPKTEIWCCAYAVDDGPIGLWKPGDPVPPEFIAAAQDPAFVVCAFNDAFERLIEQHIMAPRYGWPIVPIERHRCLQASALALSLPAKLENVAKALGLPQQKDASGHKLMMQMAQPRKRRRDEDPNGIYWFEDLERVARLHDYCKQDLEAERALYARVGFLSAEEQALWELDAKVNSRGIHLDGDLLGAAIHVAEQAQQELNAELNSITGGLGVNQVDALMKWLAEHDCIVTSMQKPVLRKVLTRTKIPAEARRVIELRLDGAHAAAAKLLTMRDWRNSDGRARHTFRYHGASTGRWTSHGIQLQNMKRPLVEDMGAAIDAVGSGDLKHIRSKYPQPMSVIGDITRALICAQPGHRLLVADFSGVESRITAWLSGQDSKLEQWAKFDRTQDPHDEPYFILGHNIFRLPETTARVTGKVGDLAFGFMGGAGAWQRLAPEDDTSTEEQIEERKRAWRNAHQHTVRFWHALNSAAITAVRHPDTTPSAKRVTFKCDATFLRMRLPSGRELSYPFPKLKTNERGDTVVTFMDNELGKWTECRHGQGAYGGTWIENAVQAVARDLFAAAMPRLEAAGYKIVLHVHDEIVVEVPNDFGSVEEFLQIITTQPDWADGLPIAAKARNGQRFCKTTKPEKSDAGGDDGATNPEPSVSVEPEQNATPNKQNGGAPARMPDALAAILGLGFDGEGDVASLHAGADRNQDDDAGSNKHTAGDYPNGERRTGKRRAIYLYRDHLGHNHTKVEKWRSSAGARAQYPQSFWVQGHWANKKPDGWQKAPYRLPEMLEALAKGPATDVYCPEGEKDCDTIAQLGLIATTNSEGATPLKAKVGKWTPELNKWFSGVRRLFILADNDEVGRAFAREKARALEGIVPDIRIVLFPDVPEGEDVTYWLTELKHTKEDLIARCEGTERWQDSATLESVRADEVTMRAIHWLWGKRFAVGKIGIIAGLPDEGKGQILCYVAARATQGLTWPNMEGVCPQGNVVILSAEENPGDSLAPRLKAAGADLSRIHFINMVRDRDEKTGQERRRLFSLVSDLEKLRRKIVEVGNVVVVEIDPISAYLGIGAVDSYRDTDVRAVLGPLKDLAEELKVAIITVMHFNKKVDITNALLRVSNSMAFVGLPRHAYGVINDTENARKLFVRAKNNDAAEADNQTLAFHFEVKEVGIDPDSGEHIIAPFIVWEPGYVDVTATEAMQAASENKSPGERDKAKKFVIAVLAGGKEVLATEIKGAGEANGLSWRTINRAKNELKDKDGIDIIVDKDRTTPDGKWFWKLA